jgi:hypothetical protein
MINIVMNEAGTKRYFKRGTKVLHRLDGPAVIFASGICEYWVDGSFISWGDLNTRTETNAA